MNSKTTAQSNTTQHKNNNINTSKTKQQHQKQHHITTKQAVTHAPCKLFTFTASQHLAELKTRRCSQHITVQHGTTTKTPFPRPSIVTSGRGRHTKLKDNDSCTPTPINIASAHLPPWIQVVKVKVFILHVHHTASSTLGDTQRGKSLDVAKNVNDPTSLLLPLLVLWCPLISPYICIPIFILKPFSCGHDVNIFY